MKVSNNVSTKTVVSERQKGSFECNVCGKVLTRHCDLLRHKQENQQSDSATTSLDRTPRVSPERQQSVPPLGELFGETVTFEEVIASGEVFPPELITPPIKRATAPGEEIAPEEETDPGEETAREEETAPKEETALEEETAREEETATEEETAPGEEIALEEETALEEKQKIPEIELPYLDSFKWGSHNRSKVGSKKFLDLIRGKVPVTQSFTVNNRQDFKNRMTRSTPCPVVLRQARGKLPGLGVPSAIHGTFRKITEGIPCSRKVNVCFSALQEVENNMTLVSFLEHHEDPFREQDLHPMNIIDLDIGPHQRAMKHTFSIPNSIKDFSLGHTYNSRKDLSIREEFDFTAGISNFIISS